MCLNLRKEQDQVHNVSEFEKRVSMVIVLRRVALLNQVLIKT